jgi:hypothetical protein
VSRSASRRWPEYATTWAPETLPDRVHVAVVVSAVRAADATRYLELLLAT